MPDCAGASFPNTFLCGARDLSPVIMCITKDLDWRVLDAENIGFTYSQRVGPKLESDVPNPTLNS